MDRVYQVVAGKMTSGWTALFGATRRYGEKGGKKVLLRGRAVV